ncbi:MAG: precorrin-6y C5,15-methyltransferase (decarboxylating) subunit CbiE [Pseudomonadota bacterium]
MSEAPWLTIIGMGEDGPAGLSPACQEALNTAEVIIGPPRHLGLLPDGLSAERHAWPVPFDAGLAQLDQLAGRQVVALASGDPFWFGAGSVIARRLPPGAWRALPGASTFSLISARLGWPLETTRCLGLHAAPLERMRPHLAAGQKMIVLLRDGGSVAKAAEYLTARGFGDSRLVICEAVGGMNERFTEVKAKGPHDKNVAHPVAIALDLAGGSALPRSSGLPDALFDHDGQITKRPVRAITLSALAPRPFETLWDIGSGSGSIAIEWLLSDPTTQATAFERDATRAARIARNASSLGVDRLAVIEGTAPAVLNRLPAPDAVFIGGGLSENMLNRLTDLVAPGTRLVANAVTLEAEALLGAWTSRRGGHLFRMELSQADALGSKRAWKAAYPIVQWSVTL